MLNKKKNFVRSASTASTKRQRIVRLDDIKKTKNNKPPKKLLPYKLEQKQQLSLWLIVGLLMFFIIIAWLFMVKHNINYLTQKQSRQPTVDLNQFRADWEKDLERLKIKLKNLSQEIEKDKTIASSSLKSDQGKATSSEHQASSSAETIDDLKAKIDELERKLGN